jgi:hypothetical protein
MARHSAKSPRATTATPPKRAALERWGSRFCAGYEVTVKIDPMIETNGTSNLGRTTRSRATGERE